MKTDWLNGPCYQPINSPSKPYSVRRARFYRVFAITAVLVMVCGALMGMGWVQWP